MYVHIYRVEVRVDCVFSPSDSTNQLTNRYACSRLSEFVLLYILLYLTYMRWDQLLTLPNHRRHYLPTCLPSKPKHTQNLNRQYAFVSVIATPQPLCDPTAHLYVAGHSPSTPLRDSFTSGRSTSSPPKPIPLAHHPLIRLQMPVMFGGPHHESAQQAQATEHLQSDQALSS